MASSGALADFGRLPNSKKVLLFVVIAAVFGFVYYRFAYKPLKNEVNRAKQTHRQNVTKHNQLVADLDKFKALRAKKDELDVTFRQHQKALPTEAEIPAFFETIENKLTAAGIDDMKFSKKPEEPFDQFVKVPLEVQITGTFLQIKKFFASLVEKKPEANAAHEKERERIVSIENLSLTQPTIRNREIVLTAKFTAVTFRQQDTPSTTPPPAPGQLPPNAPAPAEAGSTPTAPPASPPPLPSATTPAAVKAQVDEAVDRRTEQVKDATQDAAGSDRLKGGL